MRSRSALAAVVALAAGAIATAAATTPSDPLGERLAVADGTRAILDGKHAERHDQLAARVRAFYKASRAAGSPLLSDPARRADHLRQRAAARRILRRDLHELRVLRDELASVEAGRARIAASGRAAAELPAGSLTRPVPGAIVWSFGDYRGRRTGTDLTSRGVELASRRGEDVRAVDGGVVKWVGPLRELGTAVVMEHTGGVRSVIGGLDRAAVAPGRRVLRDEVIGTAAGKRIYVEIRVDRGPEGWPIDPAPLLAR